MNVIQIAQVAHESIKAFCDVSNELTNLRWDECPDWQKQSAIENAKFVLDNQDNITDEMMHIQWMNDKLNNGWKYASIKDEMLKTHPCLVPFDELSEYQQIKDRLFINVVLSIK